MTIHHRFRVSARILLAFALLLGLGASQASAQSGILFVRVSGPGGPVSGARVEVLYQEQVLGWGDADEDGRARIGGIPGGTFSVRVQAMGHEEALVEGVRVQPGLAQALEVTLELAPIEMEGLTVRAERVQIQRENTEFSTQVNQVAIELLPVSFTATDLVALTPGARPGHIWGGANFQANSYRLDGLSANHPGLGGDLLQPSIYWIDRVEVRGLGAGAEYGGFQGGLVDVVTKSGTNLFQGNVRTNFEHGVLNNSNLVSTEIGTEVAARQDVEAEVRGPILRDRLFYFLSGKYVNQDLKALNHLTQLDQKYAPIVEDRGEEKLFGKLTWVPGPTHQVELSGAYTNVHAENFDLTGFEAEGATHQYTSPTWFLNGSARELLGSWAVLEARVNHFQRNERYDPYHGKEVPGVSNFALTPPYNAFQNAPYTLRSAPASTSATLTGTFRAETWGMEHTLKVGAEVTRGSFLDRRIRNGGVTWLPVRWSGYDPGDPSTWTQPATSSRQIASHWGGEVHLDADVLNAAAFAQASLSLGSRVVLTPGVRGSQWKGWLTPRGGERFLAVEDRGLDPRIGLTVELDGSGTLVAKAHWGRYHQNMISQMFDRVAGGKVFTNEEIWYYKG
ncbi:MAG: TonB-dependent receptor, partial [Longimicrobiales bacterium]